MKYVYHIVYHYNQPAGGTGISSIEFTTSAEIRSIEDTASIEQQISQHRSHGTVVVTGWQLLRTFHPSDVAEYQRRIMALEVEKKDIETRVNKAAEFVRQLQEKPGYPANKAHRRTHAGNMNQILTFLGAHKITFPDRQ